MNKSLKFWESNWGTHFKYAIGIYIVFSFIFGFIIVLLFGVPIEYSMLLSLPWVIIFINIILIMILLTIAISKTIKRFFLILYLNDCSYRDKIHNSRIPQLTVVLPIYLMIFFVYFYKFGTYDPNFTLLLSWIVWVIIRSAYYVEREIGKTIGVIVGSFFLPFGFMTFVLLLKDFFSNPIEVIPSVIFLSYFFIILIGEVALEILMDYFTFQNRQKDLRLEWDGDPAFIREK